LSLWLVPPKNTPFTKTTQDLIPTNLLPADPPQAWLDALHLPPAFQKERNEVVLELDALHAADEFYRKLHVAVSPDANLRKLAAVVRAQVVPATSEEEARSWVEREFRPHLSLFDGEVERRVVKGRLAWVEMRMGFALGEMFACCGGALAFGGEMVLVDTRGDVAGWEGAVVARRETEWVCWRASRKLMQGGGIVCS
ncbi:hypothetical protein EJ03DRAFT_264026, partial [Teratosphaeria nubilosa]